ncbi:MAG TPA: hypothetical protein PLP27_09405 [Crocinitomicaceae bacterium]|nr:hypothetical protein [Crocinitomicaceae bacterium]
MKNTVIYIVGLFVSMQVVYAQEVVSVIPFQGMKLTKNGISYRNFDVNLDGETWVSNRLPRNKKFLLKINKPKGFKLVDGKAFPGISILFTTTKHDTLGYSKNMLGDNSEGIEAEYLSNLSVNLEFNSSVQPGDTILGKIIFFDQKSPSFIQLDGSFVITEDNAPLDQSWSTYAYSSYGKYEGQATGVELKKMDFHTDITSRPTQTGLVFKFETIGQYALDLRSADVNIIVFNKDGSTSSGFGYGHYITTFETLESDDNKKVATKIELFLSKEAYSNAQAVWVHLKNKKGSWILTGSATL